MNCTSDGAEQSQSKEVHVAAKDTKQNHHATRQAPLEYTGDLPTQSVDKIFSYTGEKLRIPGMSWRLIQKKMTAKSQYACTTFPPAPPAFSTLQVLIPGQPLIEAGLKTRLAFINSCPLGIVQRLLITVKVIGPAFRSSVM